MNKIKKISVLTCVALFILGSYVFAKTGTIENTSEGLVFRKKASKGSEPIGTLYNGTTVEILEEDGEWYKVKYEGKEGYLFAEYVKVNEEETEEPEETTETETSEEPTNVETEEPTTENSTYPKKQKVSADTKTYIMPVITSSVVTTIKSGTTVTIEKELNNWAYVTTNKTKGWIRLYNLSNEAVVEEEKTEEKTTDETEEKTLSLTYGYISESSVNLREEPNTSSKILTTLTLNTGVKIVDETEEWYKVTYNEYEGYIAKFLISEKATKTSRSSTDSRQDNSWTGYISVGVANVRKEATTNSEILTTLKQKSKVEVVGEEGDFYKINLNDEVAYVSKTLIVDSLDKIVEIKETTVTENNSTTKKENKEEEKELTNEDKEETDTTSEGERIVAFAKKYKGYDYVYGGTTPSKGFDCSGFVYYVFNSCGYDLSRSCSVQSKSGTAVSRANLQAGDLVFFDNTSDGSIGHVGIYIGEGRFIHAANPTRGVVTDTINSGYYNTYYYSARRIVK